MVSKRTKVALGGTCILIVFVGFGVGIYFASLTDEEDSGSHLDPPDPLVPLPPSESYLGNYNNAAVTTNGPPCSMIGRDILMKKGNAVEAAIAALFCEGIVCLQSMGLGGGFLMTIYDRESGKVTSLNARETAPAAADENMYDGNAQLAQVGGLAVAVPGELKGYWEAFNKFKSGNVLWEELVQPTIDLCKLGSPVTAYIASILDRASEDIKNSPSLSEILINPATGNVWVEGDRIKRLQLAKTLEVIAREGGDALYTGSLVDDFVSDIQSFDGIITKQDMADYRVVWEEPIVAEFGDGMKMYSGPPPGSGILLGFMFNILNGIFPAKDEVTSNHRVTESFKYGYGKRTELGDPQHTDIVDLMRNLSSVEYAAAIRSQISDDMTYQDAAHYGAVLAQPEDHGTAHICVLAPNGDAVSVTSTINLILGAKIRSRKTGIILNDEMDDFSAPNITNGYNIPPSPANYIKPGKRPLSSMCPSIFVDKHGDVQLIVGAAGGTKITTATALVALHNIWLNQTVKEAVDARRFHHQLFPMNLQYEYGMTESVVKGLTNIGHNMTRFNTGSTSVTAIARFGDMIHANADFRRGGTTAGY